MPLFPLFVVGIIVYVIISDKIKNKRNQELLLRMEEETPEEFLSKVEGLIEDEKAAEEIKRDLEEYRQAESNKGRLSPETTRDEMIMRQQLKVLRHSDSTGIARQERADLHKDFDLKKESVKQKDAPLRTITVTSCEHNHEDYEDHFLRLDNQKELAKAFIYAEVLAKPKAYRD